MSGVFVSTQIWVSSAVEPECMGMYRRNIFPLLALQEIA